MSYRVVVCGDRNWTNFKAIMRVLQALVFVKKDVLVIDGAASGADTLGNKAARELGCKTLRFRANWERYGKSAGPLRNIKMLQQGKPDLVLAFHNSIRTSKGTKHMVTIAMKGGVRVRLFREKKKKEPFEAFVVEGRCENCSLFCNDVTFPHLVKVFERLGNKRHETDLNKLAIKDGMVPIFSSNRVPIGGVIAVNNAGAIVGRFTIKVEEKENEC
jgi:hypothetical protein